jgi:ribosomal protein L12E/L44/L45/RPP1/RPP2
LVCVQFKELALNPGQAIVNKAPESAKAPEPEAKEKEKEKETEKEKEKEPEEEIGGLGDLFG